MNWAERSVEQDSRLQSPEGYSQHGVQLASQASGLGK